LGLGSDRRDDAPLVLRDFPRLQEQECVLMNNL
jgi:hypothetical protein